MGRAADLMAPYLKGPAMDRSLMDRDPLLDRGRMDLDLTEGRCARGILYMVADLGRKMAYLAAAARIVSKQSSS
jgi:hypothetical protein